jgi:hypothetical protein
MALQRASQRAGTFLWTFGVRVNTTRPEDALRQRKRPTLVGSRGVVGISMIALSSRLQLSGDRIGSKREATPAWLQTAGDQLTPSQFTALSTVYGSLKSHSVHE